MTVELRPLGVQCNLGCEYCYQEPQRDAGNVAGRGQYDLDLMKKAIEEEGGPFTLFGGEPLLVPLEDLERLWEWGLERWGRNSVQTNGSLITERHIALFAKYDVAVGISVDGPEELNDVRRSGGHASTRAATRRTMEAITRLCELGRAPSIIITLHRGNATTEALPRLGEWLEQVHYDGVRSVRLHLLESESQRIREEWGLSAEESTRALRYFRDLDARLSELHIDFFEDMSRMLLGQDDRSTCIWTGCDPYTTSAVRGVEGRGQRSNCGRTNKDGVDFVKSNTPGYERYLALWQTPQEYGGCQGCRFFLMCKGQCPGTAIDGDWRNRSEHCETWFSLFSDIEADMLRRGLEPLSVSPLRSELEAALADRWSHGSTTTIASLLQALPRRGRDDLRDALDPIVDDFIRILTGTS